VWHIDFETRSRCDLPEVGSFRYAEDPTTSALILAYSDGRSPPVAVDLTRPGFLKLLAPLFNAVGRGEKICAHNAAFERNIWTKVCRFPVTPSPAQWDCTAARGRLLALPGSLDGMAAALKVNTRKDPRGQELIALFCKPQFTKKKKGQDREDLGFVDPATRPDEFRAFMEYCANDVAVEMEISRLLPPMPEVERKAFDLDYRINDRGMPVNIDLVRKADAFVDEFSEAALEKATAIAGCRPSQREKTMAYLESRGFLLPNLQASTVEELGGRPDLPTDIKELVEYRIELSRAGTKKLKTIQSCVSADGRIRGGFLFSAASTRRWSSVGVQMHNLQKPEGDLDPNRVLDLIDSGDKDTLLREFPRPLTAIAQSIRGFFMSDSNFLVADYASVEPRGLAWASGEDWLLEAFRNKQDAYKLAAGRVYGVAPEAIDDTQRFMGKQLVLGCGYGMGPDRFVETCRKFGRELSPDEAREAVFGYRDSVKNITRFWRAIEAAAIKATKTWKPVPFGKFVFRPESLGGKVPILFLDMPSGSIAYPEPTLGQEEWNGELRDKFEFMTPLGSSYIRTDTFGGSLTENVIQSMTRDILRDGMVAADEAGFFLVGHCHDEAIAEDDDPQEFGEFQRLLCSSSEWAKGFPIATSGYTGQRYRK
jgi:DNA polymerase